ncbi:MAG: 50S ribosomal protein L15 [Patescibacteria group bacterium]|nr:50S ribosomal protein L15 [Patescibacteria group bacterium]
MQAHQLKARKTASRKRIGRGGKKGTYSCRGMKGQKSRSGFSRRATFEGGSSTLVAKTKKLRGFRSRNPKLQIVNIEALNGKFRSGEEVNPQTLKERKLISKLSVPVKVLSDGSIEKKLKFRNVLFSKAAREKIKKAGGSIPAQ